MPTFNFRKPYDRLGITLTEYISQLVDELEYILNNLDDENIEGRFLQKIENSDADSESNIIFSGDELEYNKSVADLIKSFDKYKSYIVDINYKVDNATYYETIICNKSYDGKKITGAKTRTQIDNLSVYCVGYEIVIDIDENKKVEECTRYRYWVNPVGSEGADPNSCIRSITAMKIIEIRGII